MDHSLQLKYQRNYSIIINDCDVSLFYYFDYGERYKQINMEFQHSHRFHEITVKGQRQSILSIPRPRR